MRAIAIAYAVGVMLAAPVTLHAADDTAVQVEIVPEPVAPEPAPTAMTPPPPPTGPPPALEPEPEPKPKPIAVAAAPGSVRMLDFSFSPATISVNVGESVTWVNAGEEPHNAVGDGFSTALLQAGKSGSKSFASAGTFSYICTVHPQMKGTVKVVAAAQTGGGSNGASAAPGTSGSDDAGTTASQSDEATGPQLADTGLDAWLLALAGVAMLVAGSAVRNRLARA